MASLLSDDTEEDEKEDQQRPLKTRRIGGDELFDDELVQVATQTMGQNTWVKVGEDGYDDEDDENGKFIKIYKEIIKRVYERLTPIFKEEYELEISCQKRNTSESEDDDTKILYLVIRLNKTHGKMFDPERCEDHPQRTVDCYLSFNLSRYYPRQENDEYTEDYLDDQPSGDPGGKMHEGTIQAEIPHLEIGCWSCGTTNYSDYKTPQNACYHFYIFPNHQNQLFDFYDLLYHRMFLFYFSIKD